jgi:NAD+ synthase (glutamine-hydrolysing)
MSYHGCVRVAAAVPRLKVADCPFNASRVIAQMTAAQERGVNVLVFPELCLTGYTCADLFQQQVLQTAALAALEHVAHEGGKHFHGLALVGLPLILDDQLFNCAAVLHRGRILGIVPKSFIPNYKEFYEGRWFAGAATARSSTVNVDGAAIPFGTDQLFAATDVDGLVVGVEICEDLWGPIPPSSFQAIAGATVLVNLSASNEVIGKAAYRRQLVVNQAGRCMAAYVYVSCGVTESTTDVVFGGHALIAENGSLLTETARFQRDEKLLVADVDLDRLRADRIRTNSFGDASLYIGKDKPFQLRNFSLKRPVGKTLQLERAVPAHPFVPSGKELKERCEEIFHTQVSGLAKRLETIGNSAMTIGVSGGLDSTLALLVACRTADLLGAPHDKILAYTMPGFGTTARTRGNALALMKELGVSSREVDIRAVCLEEMRVLLHRPFGIDLNGIQLDEFQKKLHAVPPGSQDLVFENVQARMRTSILMNSGFVVGTGDVSELALGWCTYNGDHMSMYNPNGSIPKTLVKFLVDWVAENEVSGEARRILKDIVATEISPELLPIGADGAPCQATESVVGPYELHDFFLFHFLRYGSSPEKILYLAEHASFLVKYPPEVIERWLRVFVKRFFTFQFKRSCLPDGPKVGSISVSPRGDWRMPSDASATLWTEWLEARERTAPEARTADASPS